jgi:hypothetical protein
LRRSRDRLDEEGVGVLGPFRQAGAPWRDYLFNPLNEPLFYQEHARVGFVHGKADTEEVAGTVMIALTPEEIKFKGSPDTGLEVGGVIDRRTG